MLAELESSQSEMERALGGRIRDKEMLIIGPGQQLVEMSFFARHNSVTGIDLDVIPRHPSVREYLRIFRNNGSIRTLKTMARKAMGYDRALRREAERAGLTVDSDPAVVAMDAAAMTFPDDSFNCVFSTSCFEHLSEPGDVIRQVARVLRPGGLAHVDVHLYTSDSGCHDVRNFGGRRDSIPPWSHLRPQYRSLVRAQQLPERDPPRTVERTVLAALAGCHVPAASRAGSGDPRCPGCPPGGWRTRGVRGRRTTVGLPGRRVGQARSAAPARSAMPKTKERKAR